MRYESCVVGKERQYSVGIPLHPLRGIRLIQRAQIGYILLLTRKKWLTDDMRRRYEQRKNRFHPGPLFCFRLWSVGVILPQNIWVSAHGQKEPFGSFRVYRVGFPTGMMLRGCSLSLIRKIFFTQSSMKTPITTVPRPNASACKYTFCPACPASM